MTEWKGQGTFQVDANASNYYRAYRSQCESQWWFRRSFHHCTALYSNLLGIWLGPSDCVRIWPCLQVLQLEVSCCCCQLLQLRRQYKMECKIFNVHFLKLLRRHDMTNKKKMTIAMTKLFREHPQSDTRETCDLWDIWSKWQRNMTWPTTRIANAVQCHN